MSEIKKRSGAGGLVGQGINRIDGHAKVTGRAKYAAEILPANVAYAVLVSSTAANATIIDIDDTVAKSVPGVLAVITHKNAMKLDGDKTHAFDNKLLALQSDKVYHDRQNIAVVVAEDLETANYAASLLKVEYKAGKVDTNLATTKAPSKTANDLGDTDEESESTRGDFESAFQSAPIKIDHTYTTPRETHNPMEPHAITAMWDGDKLTVYDASQGVFGERAKLAHMFGIPEKNVRVQSKFIGGGFGCKGSVWSHVPIAVMAAKICKRPVCLSLQRSQMFGPVGFRPNTISRIRMGATTDGKLVALQHDGRNEIARYDHFIEPVTLPSEFLYACDNVKTSHRLQELDIGKPTFMRAPGECPGTFALDSAIDELAYALNTDPLTVRLQNYSEKDQKENLPYSNKNLKECYEIGAERFGWKSRSAAPGSMRHGKLLVGMGTATATFPVYRSQASAKATIRSDGTALVVSGSQDLGTGTYTIMTQIAADALALPGKQVEFQLGDTILPHAPVSGGSMTAGSVGEAVKLACDKVISKLIETATKTSGSTLSGLSPSNIIAENGFLMDAGDKTKRESFASVLKRAKLQKLEAEEKSDPHQNSQKYSMHSFGAHFVEVHVEPEVRTIHIARWVGVFDAGKILNAKTARSQMYGGIVMGIGMALMEETLMDPRSARTMNADFAEYHVPVHPDIPPEFHIEFVEKPDYRANALGAHGVGELPITGAAAAIANAVYHATGVRVRELPITLDKLLV